VSGVSATAGRPRRNDGSSHAHRMNDFAGPWGLGRWIRLRVSRALGCADRASSRGGLRYRKLTPQVDAELADATAAIAIACFRMTACP